MLIKHSEMRSETREQMRGGKGMPMLTHLSNEGDLPKSCRLLTEITLAPGSGVGKHEHVGETEVYYIIKGEAKADDNGMDVMLKVGDSLITGNGAYHSIENISDTDCVFLALIIA